MAGRPARTEDLVFCAEFAEALSKGMKNDDLMAEFDIRDRPTIARYKQHPKVKSYLTKLINIRVQAIAARVDNEMDRRLGDPQEIKTLTSDELIRIRKEYLGGSLREQTEKADSDMVNAAFQAAEDPGFQAAVDAISNL